MKRGWLFVFLLAILLVLTALYSYLVILPSYSPLVQQDNDQQNIPIEEYDGEDGWIVEFTEEPLAALYVEDDATPQVPGANEITQKKARISSLQQSFKNDVAKLAPGTTVLRIYNTVFSGVAIGKLSSDKTEQLRTLSYVKEVYPNSKVEANLMDSVPLINADDVWKLDNTLKPCKDTGKPCLTGKGVTIGIIDTGIDYKHPDLGKCFGNNCKVVEGYDFYNDDADPMDDNGHGTHVAAIAAGKGVLNGVAPDATLYAFKVLDESGGGNIDDVIAAIEKSADPNGDGDSKDHLKIISLSLGARGNPDDPLSKAIDGAYWLGILPVVAAGNSGHDVYNKITSPGSARRALTVGASDKAEYLADFSSGGPVLWKNAAGESYSLIKPDVTAPGVNICAAEASSDWTAGQKCLDDKHISLSGTSMATPHVSGMAALILQQYPTYGPRELRAVIRSTAKPVGSTMVEQRGVGRIDSLAAANAKSPLHVLLFPLLQDNKTISITGEVIGTSFANYSIAYTQFKPLNQIKESDWKVIKFSAQYPQNKKLYEGFDTSKLPLFDVKTEYIIRLRATNKDGKSFDDYGYLVRYKYLLYYKFDEINFLTSPFNDDPLCMYPYGGNICFYAYITPDFSQRNNDKNAGGVSWVLNNVPDVSLVPGKKNNALNFNGGQYSFIFSNNIFDDNDLPQEFTVSLWVKLDKTTQETGQSTQIILSKAVVGETWGPYVMRINSENKPEFSFYWENKQASGFTVTGTAPLQKGQWYLLTLASDGKILSLYVDGVLVATKPTNGKAPYKSNHLLNFGAVKKNDNTYQNYLWGSLDDVRMYDKALTENEIKALL